MTDVRNEHFIRGAQQLTPNSQPVDRRSQLFAIRPEEATHLTLRKTAQPPQAPQWEGLEGIRNSCIHCKNWEVALVVVVQHQTIT